MLYASVGGGRGTAAAAYEASARETSAVSRNRLRARAVRVVP
jgi:hypothetical protein